jgi:ubiquitin-protein ligase
MSATERSWREVREDRLRADREELRKLAAGSDLIRIEELAGDPPEGYLVTYTCRGVVAPEATGPRLGDRHQVQITLPVDYPVRGPQIRWLTEIFHPNVNREGTVVCVDVWSPDRTLDELCLMLGWMIQYRNYNAGNCLRPEAASWAMRHAHLLPVDDRPLRRGRVSGAHEHEFEIKIL